MRSVRRWENALEGDAEIQRQKGLHVQMGLTAANVSDTNRTEIRESHRVGVGATWHGCKDATGWVLFIPGVEGCIPEMTVGRDLGDGKRVGLFAAPFAEGMAAADVNRGAPAVVRQGEVYPTVTAEGGAEQREKRLVLVDRQQLSIAQRPSTRGKREGHDADFAQKGFGHDRDCSGNGDSVKKLNSGDVKQGV